MRGTQTFGGTKVLTVSYESEFTYYYNGAQPKFARQGNVVTVSGVAKPVADLPYSQNWNLLFAIPAGFNPTADINLIMQGSAMNIWQFNISSGYARFSRYRTGATGNTCPAGAWLPFTATYFTTDPWPN